MKALHLRISLLIGLTLLFTACMSSETIIDPTLTDIDQYYMNPEIQEQQLYIKGAVKSGVVANLGDYSPFIIFSMDDDDLRAYLAERVISESEFLNSPDLRRFYETHIIGDAPGLIEKIEVEGAVVKAKTLSGESVTFENRDDGIDNGRGTVFVNGRELAEATLNEKDTNYDFAIDYPLIEFPPGVIIDPVPIIDFPVE